MNYKKIIEENKELINMNERYYITRPKHCYDTNYHLVDMKKEKEYLIDICDIIDEEYPEEGLIYWEDITNLTNIEDLKMYSWKSKDLEYNPYIISLIRKQ